MNPLTPIRNIMSTDLITLSPEAPLYEAKNIFETNNIHHIPVVEDKKLVGLVSHSDFLKLLDRQDPVVDMDNMTVNDIMTEHLGKLSTDDTLRTAVDLFTLNYFHALPVVEDGELVGIITTHDVLNELNKEVPKLSDYYSNQ
jgi:CBS domain-containing protein